MYLVKHVSYITTNFQETDYLTDLDGNDTVRTLLNKNIHEAYGVLKPSSDPSNEIYIDIIQRIRDLTETGLVGSPDAFELTMNDLVNLHPEINLPLVDTIPKKRFVAKIFDSSDAGYEIKKITIDKITGKRFDPNDQPDIAIEKGHVERSMLSVFENTIPVINGMWHNGRYDLNKDRVEVFGAGNTLTKSENNRVEFFDFFNIGKIETLPLHSDMIVSNGTDPLYVTFDIDLASEFPDINLTNKQVIFVLAGIPITNFPEAIWLKDPSTITVSLKTLQYLDYIVASSTRIDFSTVTSEEQVNLDEATSDTFINKIIDMDQTFLTVIDTPDPFEVLAELFVILGREIRLPKTYKDPVFPIVNTNTGMFSPYTKQDGKVFIDNFSIDEGLKIVYGQGNLPVKVPNIEDVAPRAFLRIMKKEY